MTAKRTFGWVQNPGDLRKLKKVVAVFCKNSSENRWMTEKKLPLLLQYKLISENDYILFIEELNNSYIEIDYTMLKGRGSGKDGRTKALCSGIIQAVIDGQQNHTYTDEQGHQITIKKPYVDDWSAEGYLRWAISCGLLLYIKETDKCKITELGEELARSANESKEEREALTKALLSYPPVLRILNLLNEKNNQTKFQLGSKLGFKGELGFTSIPQAIFLCDYCQTPFGEKSDIRSAEEGDSDKYARSIASWLKQMGWVSQAKKEFTEIYKGVSYTANLLTYSITRSGEKAIKRANGYSSLPRIPKIVMFEMLASNKTPGADYLRYVRTYILKLLSNKEKTLKQLKNDMLEYDIKISEIAIKDHISGLKTIGIDIIENDGKYKLLDRIKALELPPRTTYVKEEVNDIKDRVRERLTVLNHKYLSLVDLAYSNASTKSKKNADAREFEIQTADLLTNELNFDGKRLGDANRPDIIISYGENGTIIDNKSYQDGFNIDKHCADEMARYISENRQRQDGIPANEWWKEFDKKTNIYTFLFVTSFLKGNFEKQLQYISVTQNNIMGGAIGVENLLYLAENLKSGKKKYTDFYSDFQNKEMIYTV
jgi:biotin operon repressor